jgi:hypothetical protein
MGSAINLSKDIVEVSYRYGLQGGGDPFKSDVKDSVTQLMVLGHGTDTEHGWFLTVAARVDSSQAAH